MHTATDGAVGPDAGNGSWSGPGDGAAGATVPSCTCIENILEQSPGGKRCGMGRPVQHALSVALVFWQKVMRLEFFN